MPKRNLRTSKWIDELHWEVGVPGVPHGWLSAQQVEQVYHDQSYGIVEASTKSGKTRSHLHWLVSEALQAPFPETTLCWWIAPTYEQARIAFRNAQSDIRELIADVNRSAPPTITLVNGARIEFKSGESDNNLYGFEVWAVVIDEASRLDEGAAAGQGLAVFVAVESTLTMTLGLGGGRMRVIGNVRGRNNWMYQQARAAEAGIEHWYYGTRNVDDAIRDGFLDPDKIAMIRQTMEAAGALDLFLQNYYNIPFDSFLNPFGDDALDDCEMDVLTPDVGTWVGEGTPIAFGLDIARKRNWTACIGLNHDMHVCRFLRTNAEWELQRTLLRDFTEGVPTLMDATGAGDVFLPELQMAGVDVHPYIFTYDSRNQLIRRIIIGLRDRTLKVPGGVMMRELRSLETQETPGGRISYGVPARQHDDTIFGLGLATEQWHRAHEVPWGVVTPDEVARVRKELAQLREIQEAVGGVA